MREAPCEPEWRLEWVSSWNFQASSCHPVRRVLRWGGDWCSVAYQTQARTLFLVTVFLPSKVLGRKRRRQRSKRVFILCVMCDFQACVIWSSVPTYIPSVRMVSVLNGMSVGSGSGGGGSSASASGAPMRYRKVLVQFMRAPEPASKVAISR